MKMFPGRSLVLATRRISTVPDTPHLASSLIVSHQFKHSLISSRCFGHSNRCMNSILLSKSRVLRLDNFRDTSASPFWVASSHHRLNLSPCSRQPVRHLSSNQVATALRPFFFSVHPGKLHSWLGKKSSSIMKSHWKFRRLYSFYSISQIFLENSPTRVPLMKNRWSASTRFWTCNSSSSNSSCLWSRASRPLTWLSTLGEEKRKDSTQT